MKLSLPSFAVLALPCFTIAFMACGGRAVDGEGDRSASRSTAAKSNAAPAFCSSESGSGGGGGGYTESFQSYVCDGRAIDVTCRCPAAVCECNGDSIAIDCAADGASATDAVLARCGVTREPSIPGTGGSSTSSGGVSSSTTSSSGASH